MICAGVVFLVSLSARLIFGVGPFPELGVAGAGLTLVLFYAAGTAVLLLYVLSGRNAARLRPARLECAGSATFSLSARQRLSHRHRQI